MGLKEEIKQSKFRSSHQQAAINIIYTHNWLSHQIRHLLAGEKLTSQQYNVLRILRGSHPEPLSTLQIRERMLDKMSDTSRIVERLVTKKLVEKKTCPTDRRLVDISITDEGLQLLVRIDKKDRQIDDAVKNLSEEEAQQLNYLLDKIREKTK